MSRLWLWSIIAIGITIHFSSQDEITVKTDLGPVKGTSQTRDKEIVWQFRKIPYAKPPVGALRFNKPQPYGKWSGTLDGTQYGPSCMQKITDAQKRFLPNSDVSEDCLFLNIYVPRNVSRENKLDVMVWIHGGGYQTGQGMAYKPNYLCLRGDVIVVTINYRLNFFGFLSTGDSVVPGNFGLWDQRLAIQWVQNNIAAFGGNPSSVTIFGESAGGWSVGLQSLYPDNRGLFKRAIMESGVANSFIAITSKCVLATKGVGRILQCPTDDHHDLADCLRNTNASVLMDTLSKYKQMSFNTSAPHFELGFAAVVDGDFIKDNPSKLISDTSSPSYAFFRSLDVIIGNMNGEGSLLLDIAFEYESIYSFSVKNGVPNSFVCNHIAPSIANDFFKGQPHVSEAICNKYSPIDRSNQTDQGKLAVNMYGDAFFVSPAVKALEIHSLNNSNTKTFQFMFTHKPAFWYLGLPSWFVGAGHSSEIPYLFGLQDLAYIDKKITADDVALSNKMLKYWTNFAKSGDPNSQDLPEWLEYSDYSGYDQLDYNISIGHQVYADRMKFWLHDLPNTRKDKQNITDKVLYFKRHV